VTRGGEHEIPQRLIEPKDSRKLLPLASEASGRRENARQLKDEASGYEKGRHRR
jgi:hypothetical protein